MLDQASNPFSWENEAVKKYREKHMPNIEYIKKNSIVLKHHQIKSAACIPSRACLFTGNDSKTTGVHNTDGGGKHTEEVIFIDKNKTPTLGNILINSGVYKLNDISYVGKHHLKKAVLIDEEEDIRLETIDKEGNLIYENLKKYQDANLLEDLGFKHLSGPDPHGPNMLNAGFLVDTGYVDIAIDWLKKREKNTDPFVQVLSLVEPHDLVYFPHVWRIWGKKIPNNKKINIENIPLSPSDNIKLEEYPLAYQNWVKRYDKYFTEQDAKLYRQFYYYLLTIADDNLGRFLNYFTNSIHAEDTIIIFTSDHGDLCGTHGGGYQKWYCPFEEVTNVFCNIMRFKNSKPVWYGTIDYPTSHADICPTICSFLDIKYNKFTGTNIFSSDRKSKNLAITCYIQDHFTMGSNLIRYPIRMFPLLGKELDAKFVPVDQDSNGNIIYPEYAISIAWKFINDNLYKLALYHIPNNYNYNDLLQIGVLEESIQKGFVMLYDLTNDPYESKNIVRDSNNLVVSVAKAIARELCIVFVEENNKRSYMFN